MLFKVQYIITRLLKKNFIVATGIEPMTFSFSSMIYSTYVSHLNLIQMFIFYATDVV